MVTVHLDGFINGPLKSSYPILKSCLKGTQIPKFHIFFCNMLIDFLSFIVSSERGQNIIEH